MSESKTRMTKRAFVAKNKPITQQMFGAMCMLPFKVRLKLAWKLIMGVR